MRQLPDENMVYFGDTARVPYGSKSKDNIIRYSRQIIRFLQTKNVKAIVIACNTATAAAIEALRAQYPEKIVVGMEPALKLAAERHAGGRILVMATNVTLREHKFCALMDRFSSVCRVVPLPCPGLVEYIEAGCLHTPEVREHLQALLAPALTDGVDAIVLGCTHFPFLKPLIRELAGPQVEILDGGAGTAQQTRRRLEAKGLLRGAGDGTVELQNSLGTPQILEVSARLLHAGF